MRATTALRSYVVNVILLEAAAGFEPATSSIEFDLLVNGDKSQAYVSAQRH